MGDPPLLGATQVMVTSVFEIIEVAGLAGWWGFEAALIVTGYELGLKPTMLRASI